MRNAYPTKWALLLVFIGIFCTNTFSQSTLSVEGVGDFYAISALLGPNSKQEITAQLVLADDGVGTGSDACSGIVNDLNGKIALIDRGACPFTDKALNAQAAGAIAVMICNNDAQNPNNLPLISGDDMGQLNIPVKGLTFGTCQLIKQALTASANNAISATLFPAFNNLCFEAIPIQPGTYMVDTIFADPVLSGLGGAPSDPENASAAVWYSYAPEESGLLTINSCLGGADTRLLLHTGSCDVIGLNLSRVAGNDDACAFEAGNDEDNYASFIQLPVRGGEIYYIEWDNRWESKGFTFSLEFTPMEIILQPGQVCDSAIAIVPGTYTIDTISPYGQTDFYNLNGSEWYSFTPESAGLMSINSCGGGVDTRLLVFEGDCSNLTLLATSENDCPAFDGDEDDLAATITDFTVVAGKTYLIEWDGQDDPSGFDFTLSLDALPSVPVTFQVDMSLQQVSEDSVRIVWAKASPDSLNDVQVAVMSDADGDGKYAVTLSLSTLDTIGYAFVNGNLDNVANVETVPEACGVASGFGFLVRPYIVTAIDSTAIDIVCFGSCMICGTENCAQPFVLVDDNFDAYALGALGPQSPNWTTWSGTEGGSEDGIVSAEQANTVANSMKIEGNNGPQDVLLLLGDQTAGHYILSWNLYVPAGKSAYYNTQKFAESPGEEFGMVIDFNANGTGSLSAGGANAAAFTYRQDRWIAVQHFIDLNNDNIRLYIDGAFVYSWKASAQASEATGTLQLGAIDFFPARGPHLFYVDDVFFAEIPAAAPGYYAHTAEVVSTGTHTVPTLDCFGAGFQVRTNGNGRGGYWYQYTATADGYIRVGTCNNGAVDTRLWVFGGGIQNLNILGVNDDLCELTPGGDRFASYREVPVKAGQIYHILFDNPWENTGFDWFLELVEDELTLGDFCEAAIAIQPGVITIDTLNGNAAVGGPSIGISASNSFTPYANSEWYSFTAPSDGSMNVYTCELLLIRTAVYIYEGTCGIENLKLIARDPSGCDPASPVRNLPVEAGKTYYIEWASKFDGARPGFDFILEFGNPVTNVTFQVDMSTLVTNGELSADGAFISGTFNSFDVEKMADENGDNIFTFTVPLVQGDTIEYSFYNGQTTQEEIDTTLGGNCLFDVFGNRFLIAGKETTVLPPFCFGFCATCEAITGVAPTELAGVFEVYPNPTNETLFVGIELETPTTLWLELTNTLGQKVQFKQLSNIRQGREVLDVSNLPSGWYALTIRNSKQQVTRTVMIQ